MWSEFFELWLRSSKAARIEGDDVVEGIDRDGNRVTFTGVAVTGMSDAHAADVELMGSYAAALVKGAS